MKNDTQITQRPVGGEVFAGGGSWFDHAPPHHKIFSPHLLIAELIGAKAVYTAEQTIMSAPADIVLDAAIKYDLTSIFRDQRPFLLSYLRLLYSRSDRQRMSLFGTPTRIIESYVAWLDDSRFARSRGYWDMPVREDREVSDELKKLLKMEVQPIPDSQPLDIKRLRYICTKDHPMRPGMLWRWEHEETISCGDQIDYDCGDSFQPVKCVNCGRQWKEELGR